MTGLARTLAEACANEIMSAEADAVCEATGTVRNGYRERELETQFGTLTLRIPKLRAGSYFSESLIERWGRVDRAVICAASEMYALGVSTRKVGRALERMGAAGLSKDRVSRICAELDAEVAALRSRDLPDQRYPYLWVDATYVPCRKGGHGATAAVVTAIACGEDGARRVVGLGCVDTESYASWKPFLRGLRERGLDGVQCVTSDAHGGIVRAVRELFPGAAWQRCIARLERDEVDAVATRAKRRATIPARCRARCSRRPTPPACARRTRPRSRSYPGSPRTPGGPWRRPRRTRWPTWISPRSIAGGYGRITCRSAATGRSRGARAWSRAFPRRRRS